MMTIAKALLLIAFLGLIVSGCTSRSNRKREELNVSAAATHDLYPVTKIVDGDTFWVDNGTADGLKVRLIGVNAPESRRTFKKGVDHYGKEAKEYATTILTGKKVKLVCDVDSLDRYGRTLAYVYLEDSTFLNAHLIEAGYAQVMTVPPNVRFAEMFLDLQREARERGRGLWRQTK